MQFHEYGAAGARTVVLLHGGGLSWWNFRDEAALLSDRFRVILPILDGHAGSDRPFTTIRDNAEEIIAWIDAACGGTVFLLGGLSLGAQIALEMLSIRPDLCRFAIIESAAAIPSPLMRALIGPAVGCSYSLMKNRRFAEMQFRSLRIRPDLFEDYYRDTCAIRKADMIAFLGENAAYAPKAPLSDTRAKVLLLAGAKETGVILRSVRKISAALPSARTVLIDGLHHGELSINRPEAYVDLLLEQIGESDKTKGQ